MKWKERMERVRENMRKEKIRKDRKEGEPEEDELISKERDKEKYRVFHGFWLRKWDDYFWVNFDHFFIKHHFSGKSKRDGKREYKKKKVERERDGGRDNGERERER